MLSVEQALEKILGYVDALEVETKPILESLGQVLAEDIYSSINVPPLDNSAMDGYAVRAVDTRGASKQSPRLLRIIDTVTAGSVSEQKVELGTTIRIMTGAPMPEGADSVVRLEDTDEAERTDGQEISILSEVEPGRDIRRAGEDIARGVLVLARGTVIRPSEVGVFASLGHSSVRVIRRPVVAVLATGNELVDIGQPLPMGKIYNSNSYSVAALVQRCGGIPHILGIAMDSESSLIDSLNRGANADMLITTAGVSVGAYDVVKDVLAKQGEIAFWRVRIKPGKPLAFSMIKGASKMGVSKKIPHLGLPGNPVSAMITFELFARPAILKMLGKKNLTKPIIEAVLEEPVINDDGRRVFARAIVEKRGSQYFASLTGPQGSGILTSMSLANGLVIVPEDRAKVDAGDVVQVMMLDWNEEVAATS
jgi:molybdopterin molybdotransferase